MSDGDELEELKLSDWDELPADQKQVWLDDADAVIRELDDMGIIHLSRVRHDD